MKFQPLLPKYMCITPLTYLINKSFKEGIFPVELNLARVVPILEAGDSSQIANYRPIYVLTLFSKVLEKIILFYTVWMITTFL